MIWLWRFVCVAGWIFFAVPAVYYAVNGDTREALMQMGAAAGIGVLWALVEEAVA